MVLEKKLFRSVKEIKERVTSKEREREKHILAYRKEDHVDMEKNHCAIVEMKEINH